MFNIVTNWGSLFIGLLFVVVFGLQIVSASTSIPYEDLLRSPDLYENEEITMTGEVIQALDLTSALRDTLTSVEVSDGQGIMLAINKADMIAGRDDDVQLVQLFLINKPLGKRVIEKDTISVKIIAAPLYTYTRADGAGASIPAGIVISGKFI